MEAPRIMITAGEPAGIGPDVILNALHSNFEACITVVGDINVLQQRVTALNLDTRILPIEINAAPAQHAPGTVHVLHTPCPRSVTPGVLDPDNAAHIIQMLNTAAAGVADGRYDAIVTAPIQKSLLNDAGIHFTGHTEFFRDYFGCDEVVMMLATEGLRVALATTHLPLRLVPDAISEDLLTRQFTIIDKALRQFYGIEKPRIAMLGLNPHAGEDGHLGREEIEVLIPAQKTALANGLDVSLPIPADTAFVSPEVKTADIVLAMFHDQGLPVLKTQGFGSSVNITLGLPIIRTSVDHGTALDRAGQGNASCQSMIAAITEAISCARHIQLGR